MKTYSNIENSHSLLTHDRGPSALGRGFNYVLLNFLCQIGIAGAKKDLHSRAKEELQTG
jgi:hypothetical protein